MADPQDFIDSIINNAIDTARSMTEEASDAADELVRLRAGFYLAPPTISNGFSVSAVEPTVEEVEDAKQNYAAERAYLISLLAAELAKFFNTYYPLANDAFDEANTWLINAITNQGTGINTVLANSLWQQNRARLITEGNRLGNQIYEGYAAKGIMLPAGSMLKKSEEARYRLAGELGIASTNIALHQYDTEISNIKFAIEKALASREMAMNAAADYIRAVASVPASAVEVANLNADAKARMIAAASDLYRARLERDNLVLQSTLAEKTSELEIYTHRRNNAVQAAGVDAQALAAAADVFGRTAAAAISSLNTIASTATNSFA